MDAAAAINAKLAELGSEFVIAADLSRVWATGAQAFVSDDFSMVIFREQNILAGATPGDQDPFVSLKNVASIILPTAVLLEFHQNLAPALEQWKAKRVPDAAAAE